MREKKDPHQGNGKPIMDDEQWVQVDVRLSDDAVGSAEEQARLVALMEELEAACAQNNAGMLEGDEWGNGLCRIFLYGPDANAILAAIRPVLENARLPAGSYTVGLP